MSAEPTDRAAYSPDNRCKGAPLSGCAALIRPVESVEKVPKHILGKNVKKTTSQEALQSTISGLGMVL
jgi:hypothetical protein